MRANLRDELLSEYVAGELARRDGRAAGRRAAADAVREGRPLGDLLPDGASAADAIGLAAELVDRVLAGYERTT
jgi:hypothetical protein